MAHSHDSHCRHESALEAGPVRPLSVAARTLLVAQRLYKLTLSPLIGRQCRYLPTCSDYGADCVRQYGAWYGSWMTVARLCRCHPAGGSGWDPAPLDRKPVSWWQPWKAGDWKGGVRSAPNHEQEQA
jgi:uncharacterized protein